MAKKIIQIVLAIAIIFLGYTLYEQIMAPLRFDKTVEFRKEAVIDRIKDIRSAQQAYKQVYQKYTDNFDTLINFVLNGKMEFEKQLISEDDSAGLAELKKLGRQNIEKFTVAVIDTIFGTKKLTPDAVKKLRYIPYTDNVEFRLDAGDLTTASKVVVPVFECRAPYKDYLGDLDEQLLINLIDEATSLDKYPGIKVGSMTQATNDAGNWE